MSATSQEQELDRALRLILRMFAEGALAYRRREWRCEFDVAERARRVRSFQ